MTELLYIENPDLFETYAKVVARGGDSRGSYIILDRSIFYPQGGGQPADRGEIVYENDIINISNVRYEENEVRHYIGDGSSANSKLEGQTVEIAIDQKRRERNAKAHTAGHLIAAVSESISPVLKAVKGHHFPGEAYVEFNGAVQDLDLFESELKKALDLEIKRGADVRMYDLEGDAARQFIENLPYSMPQTRKLRVCEINGHPASPCGGTHVKNLEEIAAINIAKCKCKKGKTKVYYDIA